MTLRTNNIEPTSPGGKVAITGLDTLNSNLNLSSIKDLCDLTPVSDGQIIDVTGFFDGSTEGGGKFKWEATGDKSTANGGTIIDPTAIAGWDGGVSLLASTYYNGTTGQGTGTGTGVWIRVYDGELDVKWFGAIGDGVADDQAAMDKAWNYAWVNSIPLFIPRGIYKVDKITLAGDASNQDRILKVRGVGFGNPFAAWTTKEGSTILSTGNNPVFQVTVDASPTTPGAVDIEGVIFDGTSQTPVVDIQAFYGAGRISRCCIFQRSTGVGFESRWMTTCELKHIYCLNKDWPVTGLGASRVGIGFNFPHDKDSGLQTLYKCTSRGFHTAYKLGQGGASEFMYNATIRECEASVNYSGIHLTNNARATLVDNCYMEGGEGGDGIYDQGDYNKVTNCFTFSEYSKHLRSEDFTYGNYYSGNTFSAGTKPNQVLASITSSSVNGGPGKTFSNNHLSFGGSGGTLAGVVGIRTTGTEPRIDLSGNNFFPRGGWVGGAGTVKLDLAVQNYGFSIAARDEKEMPFLSQGVISLAQGATLTESNVSGNTLILPAGSYFQIAPSSPVTINQLSAGGERGRFVIIRSTNANTTIQDSAFILLDGNTAFTGTGMLVLFVDRQGGSDFAFEISRTAL